MADHITFLTGILHPVGPLTTSLQRVQCYFVCCALWDFGPRIGQFAEESGTSGLAECLRWEVSVSVPLHKLSLRSCTGHRTHDGRLDGRRPGMEDNFQSHLG